MSVINIVGAGIAGSITARLLVKRGHKVRVFDDRDKFSGSLASSNLYIASWLKKFGSSAAAKGIDVLESLFPQSQIDQPFARGIADAAKIRHIAQRHLLVTPDVVENISVVGARTGAESEAGCASLDKETYDGPVVLCCGYKQDLVTVYGANGPIRPATPDVLVGQCLFIQGRLPPGTSSITMPLPYRHTKLYQFDENNIYFADSTRLTLKSWLKRSEAGGMKRELLNKARVVLSPIIGEENVPWESDCEHRVGYRPCIPEHDFGELKTLAPGVWSMNGGGKNGLVAYAALAARLADEIGPPG